MNRLKLLTAALALSLAVVPAAGFAQDQAKPAARVEVLEVKTEPQVYKGFSENSTLEAIDQVTIYPRISGRLMKMLVKQGDQVKSGQPLAELDHREMDAQVAQAQAQIAVAQAQVAQAMAELENAQRERDRYKRLVKEGFSTQQQLDAKETAYRTTKAAVDLNMAQVRQYQANLKRLQVDLSEYTLKASIPGTIVNDYNRTPGEMITTQTALAQIADTTKLKAVIQATESHAKLIENGMAATVTIGELNVKGQVYRVRPFVDVSTRTTQVEVAMDNPGDLKPGMFARVFIVEKELKNAIMIPAESVQTDGQIHWVMVSKEGKAHRIEVKTGVVSDGRIEIVEGLSPGDRLIVSGGRNLNDQDPVSEIGV